MGSHDSDVGDLEAPPGSAEITEKDENDLALLLLSDFFYGESAGERNLPAGTIGTSASSSSSSNQSGSSEPIVQDQNVRTHGDGDRRHVDASTGDDEFIEASIRELIDAVNNTGILPGKRHDLCARILNHPEVNQMLTTYPSYNDGLRELGSTGAYLFERNAKKIGDDAKVVDGSAADWDPEFMKGLAIILPNDLPVGNPEVNPKQDKLHFSGGKNRVKTTNVIYQRTEKNGTDNRYVAYIYFRVNFKTSVIFGKCATRRPKTNGAESSKSTLGGLDHSRSSSRSEDVGREHSEVGGSRLGEGGGTHRSTSTLSENMEEFVPLCQDIAERLSNCDDLTKRKFLSLMSDFILNSEGQQPPTTELANEARENQADRRRKAEESAPDEGAADAHRKPRLRKSADGSVNLSEPLRKFMNECLNLASDFELDVLDNETSKSLYSRHNNGDIKQSSATELHPGDLSPAKEKLLCQSLGDESSCELVQSLRYSASNFRDLRASTDDDESITIDAKSWEEFKNRIAAQEASHSEMFEDEQITGNVSTQDDNDGPISALVALMNKLNVKTAPKHTTTDSDEVAHASECTLRNANANPFDKALIEAQNGYNVASENIAWGAAQVHYNISSMSGNAGPPVQPYMSTEDEQRARMTALFKAVDPSKLSRVDEFVEKRKKK